MNRSRHRLPSSEVLKACPCLAGVDHQGDLLGAIRTVLAALETGVTLPRSAVLDLARGTLDAQVDLDRHIRLAAAKALARFNEREVTGRATQAIRNPSSPLDVVMAAATILLDSPYRRLSRPTVVCLVRRIRRFGQIRGPLVELLQFAQPSRRAPR